MDLQKYANVPGRSNVVSNRASDRRVPESNEPSLALTVWTVGSRFVHVTGVPTGTSSGVGANAKSAISISPSAGPGSTRRSGARGLTTNVARIPISSCSATKHSIS